MIRYTINCPHRDVMVEPADDGEWVRFSDIEAVIGISANIAERHDRFLKTLRDIAAMPSSISVASAVGAAKDALEKGRRGFSN